METAATQLHRALEAFRRDHALGFIQRATGQTKSSSVAQRFLVSERAEECLSVAVSQGELSPAEHAAIAAHMARAQLELSLEKGRARVASWPGNAIAVEGETRPVRAIVREWLGAEVAPKRMRLAREIASSIPPVLDAWFHARDDADGAATALLRRLAAPRHADAGPEGGAGKLAEALLTGTHDLASEAFAHACTRAGIEGADATELLWALTGARFSGLFHAEARSRRIGNDWDALGLRRALASHARSAPAHPGLFPYGHVLVASAPSDVRVSLPALEHGLLSELAAADAVGRAVGMTHASPSLPTSLRHGSVSSVARSLGALGGLMFAEPLFLMRVRGLSRRESEEVARLAAAFSLLEARLCAAAVLSRGLHGDNWLMQSADLASRALTRTLPTALGAWFVTRVSPGAPLRAKVHALAIAAAFRERFDEDWFRNPRAGEPLRGAALRAGTLSVEAFAAELGAEVPRGHQHLSALF